VTVVVAGLGQKLPVGQVVQLMLVVVEHTVEMYCPEKHVVAQLRQTVALAPDAYTPAPQVEHVTVPELEAYEPGLHAEQVADD